MNKILKISVLLIVFLPGYQSLFSQDAEAELENNKEKQEKVKQDLRFIDKFTFGGGFGLSFGSYTRIAVSPLVGYRPIPRVLIGAEGRYAYIKDSYNGFKTYYYGFGPLARLIVYKGFFLQAQAEFLNFDDILFNSYVSNRKWNTAVLVGAGYRQQLSERSFYYMTVLWDINDTSSSLYVNNPIIRMGITF